MNVEIIVATVQGLFTVFAALATAWFALFLFYKQREYEIAKQRYLDGGVDVVASEIENALGVFNHNWSRCLNIIKSFKDGEEYFDLKELGKGFIEYESIYFHEVSNHRIQSLTESNVYWEVYQVFLAFCSNSMTIIQHEIPETIRIKLTTSDIKVETEELANKIFSKLEDIQNDSHKFSMFASELQLLAKILEKDKLSIKNIQEFKEKPEVKASIKRLEKYYEADLKGDS